MISQKAQFYLFLLRPVLRTKSGEFSKLILLLKMNQEVIGYNLKQTELKLAH